MTGAPPVPDRPALWAALSHMQIEETGASLRFEEVLAGEQGWPLDFAERVTNEYRRFLYLAATAGFEVTPSRTVDEAWHLHLRSRHYREVLCRQILGRPLDHRPAAGEPGEAKRHRGQYERTVQLYESAFLKPPPSDIWPQPVSGDERKAERNRRWRNLARGAAAGTALAAFAAYFVAYPLTALFLALLASIILLVGERVFSRKARSSGGDGGGAGCGSGAGRADDGPGGGDASCGGGCGGD